ncbi:FMR1 neighbor protein [Callithrix jacchus]
MGHRPLDSEAVSLSKAVPGAMPSDRRQVRGRNRSRTHAARIKITPEVVESGSYPESSYPEHEAATGNEPRPGWRASLHGFWAETRRFLRNIWLHRRFWLFTLSIWILPLVCYHLYSEFPSVPLNGHSLENNEDTNGQSLGKDFALEALLNFFFPTKPKQMMRMSWVGAICLMILGYLLFYCCSLCWRRKWANLQSRVKRGEKSLKKPRNVRRRKTEMLQKAAGRDEKDGEE